jgi:hypothetical protein
MFTPYGCGRTFCRGHVNINSKFRETNASQKYFIFAGSLGQDVLRATGIEQENRTAYHKADKAIQRLVDLLAAA